MISMADHVAISVKTPMIDIGCSLEKQLTELIYMNPLIIFYIVVNYPNLLHGYVCGPLP